jgi:DNA-binding transcriptional LysR family regulator
VPHLDFISRTETFPPVRALVEGELDVALVCSKITQRGLTVVALFEDELVAVLPQGHRLSEQVHVEARDLSQETYVSYSRIVEHGLEDDLLFRPGRIAPARFIQADSVEAILDHVEAGLGFSILSRWAAQGGSRPMVALRSITEGGLRVAWSAVTQNPRQPAAEFVRHLANEMARGGPEPTASRGPAGSA